MITDQVDAEAHWPELAHRLREIRDDLPVILYTGHGEGLADDEVERGAACARCMRKPVDPALLSQILARCLASARTWRHDAQAPLGRTIDTN